MHRTAAVDCPSGRLLAQCCPPESLAGPRLKSRSEPRGPPLTLALLVQRPLAAAWQRYIARGAGARAGACPPIHGSGNCLMVSGSKSANPSEAVTVQAPGSKSANPSEAVTAQPGSKSANPSEAVTA